MSYLKSFFPLQKFNEFIQVDKWVPSERCDVCLQSLSVKAELSHYHHQLPITTSITIYCHH